MAQLHPGISPVVVQIAEYCFDFLSEKRWTVPRGSRQWWEFRQSFLDDSAIAHITIKDQESGQRLAEPVTVYPSLELHRSREGLIHKVASEMERAAVKAELEWAVYWSGHLWC